jgi:hypothetical protein
MGYTTKDFLKLAEKVGRRFYSVYQNEFIGMAMDSDDVVQESKMVVLLLEKNKKLTGITFPLVKQAVTWKLTQMRDNYRRIMKDKELLPISQVTRDKNGEEEANFEEESLKIDPIKPSPFDSPTEMFKHVFQFKQLKYNLPKIGYQVVEKRLLKEETYAKIGEDLGYTRQRIEQIYKKTMKRIKLLLLERSKIKIRA